MNGAADELAGDLELEGLEPLERPHRGRLVRTRDANAERLEQPLGVVARRVRLDHGRRPILREQPGDQHRRLHLRARNGQLVADRMQGRPGDADRRVPVSRLDLGPHEAEGRGDTLVRARGERFVADELEGARLAGEEPAGEAHAVPAFPQSIGSCGARALRRPTPRTRTSSAATSTTSPPIALATVIADSVSAARPKPVILLSPSASAPSRTARWEIPFTPGTAKTPFSEAQAQPSSSTAETTTP